MNKLPMFKVVFTYTKISFCASVSFTKSGHGRFVISSEDHYEQMISESVSLVDWLELSQTEQKEVLISTGQALATYVTNRENSFDAGDLTEYVRES